jgi:hypothetical protein
MGFAAAFRGYIAVDFATNEQRRVSCIGGILASLQSDADRRTMPTQPESNGSAK